MPPKKLAAKGAAKPEPKKRARSATTPVKPVKKATKAEEDTSAPAKVAANKKAAKEAPAPAPAAPKPKAAGKTKTPVAKVSQDAAPAPAPAAPKAAPKKAAAAAVAAPAASKPKGIAVFRSVPGRDAYTVVEDYSCTLNQTDIVNNNNKYYLLAVLVDGAGNHAFYSEWGRVGAPNPQNSFIKNITKQNAISQFESKFRDKTSNQWYNRDNFQKIDGKYQLVEVDASDDADGDDSSPLGKLTKGQLEQGLEVLEELKPYLDKKSRSSNDDAEIKRLNSKFFSLIPTDVGFKKAVNLLIHTPAALDEKKGSILFLMKMAFSVDKKKPKKAPAAANATSTTTTGTTISAPVKPPSPDDEIEGENKLAGVLSLPLVKTLKESLKGEYEWAVNSAVQSSEANVKNKSGDQIKPMDKELIAAIKLYTGSWYGTVNTPLRVSNRKACEKFFSYIRMLKEACGCLKQCSRELFRGIGCDLSEEYKVGDTITWWAISSTTSAKSVAENFMKAWSGGCTFCTIQTKTAVEISQLSFYPSEKEFLLLPGTQLKVTKAWKDGKVFKVNLEEVGSAMTA